MSLSRDEESSESRLRQYCVERDALLQDITRHLERDHRVSTAWLFGSLGRGEGDVLSDLDVWVVVDDEHMSGVATRRREYVGYVRPPLLLVEAPQNAPAGGAYLMAMYQGEAGPHLVDWYWQVGSNMLEIPSYVRVLHHRTDKAAFSSPGPDKDAQPSPVQSISDGVVNSIHFFWMMLLIAAKYAARSPSDERMGLFTLAFGALGEVQRFVGMSSIYNDELPFTPEPAQKLSVLRALAQMMESLLPQVTAQGVRVPSGAPAQAFLYIDLVEILIQQATDRSVIARGNFPGP